MGDYPEQKARSDAAQGADASMLSGVDTLLPLVHDELHALAAAVLSRHRRLDAGRTTSLVNDAYVRLAHRGLAFQNRSHFLCLAAQAMRRILIDRARRRFAAKRGGARGEVGLDDEILAAPDGPDLLALDDALARLASFDKTKSRIVELRFFGGLTVEETGEVLRLSPASVKREWALARAWLFRELGGNCDVVEPKR
ncbi:MAG: ECF-type sigma factor [Phycisphaerae bacterium]